MLCFTLLCFGFCRRRGAGAGACSYANDYLWVYHISFPFYFTLHFSEIFFLYAIVLSFVTLCN